MAKQLTPAFWANAGNAFQTGTGACLAAALAMSGDGKTVGFIPDMLDQMQRRGMTGQNEFIMRVVEIQGFHASLAGNTLGDAQQGQAMAAVASAESFSDVALIYMTNDYGAGLADSFEDSWSEALCVKVGYDQDATDFTTTVQQVADGDCGSIVSVTPAATFTLPLIR